MRDQAGLGPFEIHNKFQTASPVGPLGLILQSAKGHSFSLSDSDVISQEVGEFLDVKRRTQLGRYILEISDRVRPDSRNITKHRTLHTANANKFINVLPFVAWPVYQPYFACIVGAYRQHCQSSGQTMTGVGCSLLGALPRTCLSRDQVTFNPCLWCVNAHT